MAIGAILGVIFFIAFVGAVVFSIVNVSKANKSRTADDKKKYKVRNYISVPAAAACFLLFLFIPFSFHTVNAGEIAVVKHLGKAVEVRTSGTYFDFWITKKYDKYDSKVQNLEIKDNSYSKDAQTMDITMAVQFQINSYKGIEIAERYGSIDALSSRLKNVVIEKTKATLSSYSAMEIIEQRSQISPKVEGIVKEAVDESFYITIEKVVLTNIDFSDAFEQTVEDKMIAEQQKLKAEYEKETAIIKANQELEVAKLQADARIEAARGDAQAKLLAAQAEADAMKAKSLEVARMLGFHVEKDPTAEGDVYFIDFTGEDKERVNLISEYLKYTAYLEAWDGKLPDTVVTNGGASILIPTPGSGNAGGGTGGTETNP